MNAADFGIVAGRLLPLMNLRKYSEPEHLFVGFCLSFRFVFKFWSSSWLG